MIQVSVVLSIHNRAELLRRAMAGYRWQTLDPRRWELVVVDDGSTDHLEEMLREEGAGLNVRLIRMDHTRHPIFRERNPAWRPGDPKSWFHTPALSINLGVARARGEVICLCHPEVIQAPDNLRNAKSVFCDVGARTFAFGRCYLGTQAHNDLMDDLLAEVEDMKVERMPVGADRFDIMLTNLEMVGRPPDPGTPEARANAGATPYHPGYWYFTETELYWYLSFLPKSAVEVVRGVDFEYLHGVAGEDDDFRERVNRVGCRAVAAHDLFRGFHQDHSHEQESHRQRDSREWADGLTRNRALLAERRRTGFTADVNLAYDWTAPECIVNEVQIAMAR